MSVDFSRTPISCPSGWREAALATVADIRFSNVDKKSTSGEKPVRLCNYTDVYNNDYVTNDMEFMQATATLAEIDRFGLHVGDVILTKDSETPNDIGVPTVVDSTGQDLLCGYHLALVRPNQSAVEPTFLAKQLGSTRVIRYLGQQANGSTRYGLSTGAISGLSLHLPPLGHQQAVTRILRLVDAAIERTRAVIAKLRRIRAGLLLDLLTCGLDDNGELRDPDKHPEQFHESPLGRMPKEWDCVSPASLCHEITKGATPADISQMPLDGWVPFIRVQNLGFDGRLKLDDDMSFISPQIHREELSRSRVIPGDVLMNLVGPPIGKVSIVPRIFKEWNINQAIAIFRTREPDLNRYLAYYLLCDSSRLSDSGGGRIMVPDGGPSDGRESRGSGSWSAAEVV